MDTSTGTSCEISLFIFIKKNTIEIKFQPKSSGKQKSSNAKNGNTPSRTTRNSSQNDPVESEEEIAKKIDLLRTILLSYDDWLSIDELLKVSQMI